MAIAFVSAGNGTGTASPVAATFSPTAGNALIVIVSINQSAARTVTGVTDNATGGSSTYAQLGSQTSSTRAVCFMFYCASVKAGATSISAALSGTVANANIVVMQFTGIKALGIPSTTTSGSSVSPAITLTGCQPDSYVVFGIASQGLNTFAQKTATLNVNASKVSTGTSTTGSGCAGTYQTTISAGSGVGDVTINTGAETFGAVAVELFATPPPESWVTRLEIPVIETIEVNSY